MAANPTIVRSETDIWIILYLLADIACIVIFLSQIVGLLYNYSRLKATEHESWSTQQGSTKHILIALFLTYFTSIVGIAIPISRLNNVTQVLCRSTYQISLAIHASAKTCNYYFFLQRAKFAQGMTTLLPWKVFDKLLPALLAIIWLLDIVLILVFPLEGNAVVSPNTSRRLCVWQTPDLVHVLSIIIASAFDLFMTAFMLYLYGKPLLDIVHYSKLRQSTNSVASTAATALADTKMRRCIIINFLCSSIASLHSSVISITWWNGGFMSWYAVLDFLVNSICLFCMFASNRRLCLHCVCCCNAFVKYIDVTLMVDDNYSVSEDILQIAQTSRPSSPSPSPDIRVKKQYSYTNSVHSKQSDSSSSAMRVPSGLSPDGTNYMQYLYTFDNSCVYYKAKLFWTWFMYYFCFCGKRCYVYSLLKVFENGDKSHERQAVMKYMFLSAQKIQHIRMRAYRNRLYLEHRSKRNDANPNHNHNDNDNNNDDNNNNDDHPTNTQTTPSSGALSPSSKNNAII